MSDTLIDPELGSLIWNSSLELWEGTLKLTSKQPFKLYIFARSTEMRSITPESRAAINRIRNGENEFRQFAMEELLDIYNAAWSEGRSISPEEFIARLSPDSIDVFEKGRIEIHFDDGGLFSGHLVGVRFNEDGSFLEAVIEG